MIFFHTHKEQRIGFKKLSAADLGLSPDSHQTHIGLYEDVLTFLDDSDVVKSAMLIYGDYCDILDCNFDRIENPDHTFRSPKIKKGNVADSVVVKIQEFAAVKPAASWYLVWCGLDSNELLFWLFESDSDDYKTAKDIFVGGPKVLTPEYDKYNNAVTLLESKVNYVSMELQKDLEVISQTGVVRKTYRPIDIEKANNMFKATGRLGEELIAEYLDKKKTSGEISSFRWMNINGESGAPFDFIINEELAEENFIDVKATRFDFDQQIIFSSQEVEFVDRTHDDLKYSVFRVYNLTEVETKLKICRNCLSYMSRLNNNILNFKNTIEQDHVSLAGAKLAILPDACFSMISDPILI